MTGREQGHRRSWGRRGSISFEAAVLAALVALGAAIGLTAFSASKRDSFEAVGCRLHFALGLVDGCSVAGTSAATNPSPGERFVHGPLQLAQGDEGGGVQITDNRPPPPWGENTEGYTALELSLGRFYSRFPDDEAITNEFRRTQPMASAPTQNWIGHELAAIVNGIPFDELRLRRLHADVAGTLRGLAPIGEVLDRYQERVRDLEAGEPVVIDEDNALQVIETEEFGRLLVLDGVSDEGFITVAVLQGNDPQGSIETRACYYQLVLGVLDDVDETNFQERIGELVNGEWSCVTS